MDKKLSSIKGVTKWSPIKIEGKLPSFLTLIDSKIIWNVESKKKDTDYIDQEFENIVDSNLFD